MHLQYVSLSQYLSVGQITKMFAVNEGGCSSGGRVGQGNWKVSG